MDGITLACRCGHGRAWHRRRSGKVRLPCQWRLGRGRACACRDYVPHPTALGRRWGAPPIPVVSKVAGRGNVD